ncbi:MAG: hypothetical protein ACREA9_29975 [Pyrinomonadaceae bacterium]
MTSKSMLRAKLLTFIFSWYTSSLPIFNSRSRGGISPAFQVLTALCPVHACSTSGAVQLPFGYFVKHLFVAITNWLLWK